MKGLLQKAHYKLSTVGNKPDLQKTDPVKAEIYSEIDGMVDKLHEDALAVSSNYSVSKNDGIIPLVVITSSIIILIAGGLFFLNFYNSKEKTIVSTRNRVLSTESKILAAVKAESEQQLEIRDQRINSIQIQLSTAIEDRKKLKEDTEKTLNARELELKNAMDKTLEAERVKLLEQGLSSEDIQKKIAETSSKLEAENKSLMDDFKKQYEQELREKELAMTRQIDNFKKTLQESQLEQNRLQEKIKQKELDLQTALNEQSAALGAQKNSLQNLLKDKEAQNNREQLVFSKLLSSYKGIEDQIKNKNFETAGAEIETIEDYLNQESVSGLPEVKVRLNTENFIISTLQDSISREKIITEVFPKEKAELKSDISNLKRQLSNSVFELKAKDAKLQQTEKEHEILKSLIEKVEIIDRNTTSQEQIVDLLETKTLLKQVLSSEPLKSQYPQLLDQVELYFDALGDTKKEEGRKTVLNELDKLMEPLNSVD